MTHLTVSQVADRAGISPTSVRAWSIELSEVLSPGAVPEPGAVRRFTEDDVDVLHTAKILRAEGQDWPSIIATIEAGQRIIPAEEDVTEPGAAAGAGSQTPAGMALELFRGQIESLENERDYLRSELDQERQARITAEKEAAHLAGRLEALEAKPAEEQPRPGFLDRFFGRK